MARNGRWHYGPKLLQGQRRQTRPPLPSWFKMRYESENVIQGDHRLDNKLEVIITYPCFFDLEFDRRSSARRSVTNHHVHSLPIQGLSQRTASIQA